MPFLSSLKKVGLGIEHVGKWIDDVLKVVAPEVEAVVPSTVPLISAVESVTASVEAVANKPLSANTLQQITQAVTTLETINPGMFSALFKGVVTEAKTIASVTGFPPASTPAS